MPIQTNWVPYPAPPYYNPYQVPYTQQYPQQSQTVQAPQTQQMPQQSQLQSQPLQSGLQFQQPAHGVIPGKMVDSIDVVKAFDIPLDGSITYFPATDGSAIYTKQLGQDGAPRVRVYRLQDAQEQERTEQQPSQKPAYIDVIEQEIGKVQKSIEQLSADIKNGASKGTQALVRPRNVEGASYNDQSDNEHY